MPLSKSNTKPKPSNQTISSSRISFDAIGTEWEITIDDRIAHEALAMLRQRLTTRIEQFDHNYSRFRPDSLVSAMAKHPGTYQLPNDAQPLLDLYKKLYDCTNGAVTPLIGQLLSDAGYNATYALKSRRLHAPPTWSVALEYIYPKLIIKQPALLDFGAAGKGYLVDIVAAIMHDAGLNNYCVNASGDILERHTGGGSRSVGLEHPDHSDEVIGIAELHNQSICGSAGNKRAWRSFTHIMDPSTQASPRAIKATWVIAETTLLADGLATALFFTEARALKKTFDFEYTIIYQDDALVHSEAFPATYYTEQRREYSA
jgi:thiamine biosynthesis lipoprotein